MAITPQAIKDQEFQVKFRGYDAIEVKAYLELIADEFFELFEEVRHQADDIEGLVGEKEDLGEQHATLEGDMATLQRKYDQLAKDLEQKNEQNAAFQKEINELKAQVARLEAEGKEKEERWSAAAGLLEGEVKEKDALKDRLHDMEKQWDELKKDEIEFKETLIACQKFSKELMKKSEEEANQILGKAREEAEKLRQETLQELTSYPKEIERLRIKRDHVREDLKTVLTLCLENLDIFTADDEEEEDYSDLFQSVMLSDDGTVNSEELAKLDMDLDLPASFHTEKEAVSEATGESDEDDLV
jgi:DivIVA domain-containing protein